MPLRKNRQLLLAKVETTFNTDPSPTAAADAILCEAPEFSVDSTMLTRQFIKPTLDRTPHAMGRKLAKLKFVTEIRGGGTAGTQCKLGRLLTGCGFTEQLFPSAVTGIAQAATVNTITLAAAASAVNDAYTGLMLTISSGTGSGSTGVIIDYNGTTKVATVDAWSGTTPAASSNYSIEAGASYSPTSDPTQQKSLTFYLYMDGNLHIITGCYGTVNFEAAVNGYGKATFEFVGQYTAPTAVALPSGPTYETTIPSQVQTAQLVIDSFIATCSKFTLDMGIKVLPRLDANGSDGYNGTYIDSRDPKGGIDPEAPLVGSYNFWSKLASAASVIFKMRVGTAVGNSVRFAAPNVQYTGLTYGARDMLQTLDAGLAFNGMTGSSGDDEVSIAII